MAYSISIKEKVENLRKKGFSLNEIHQTTRISKSVISGWTRDVILSNVARKRLLNKIKIGQFISAEKKKAKTAEKIKRYQSQASIELKNVKIDKNIAKIICALMYWCEGGKNYYNGIHFTNSDPKLIKSFLYLFRYSFNIDENKFRACIHLHEYHNPGERITFWSKLTRIPKNKFIKPFLKKNTGKNIKKDYPGCIDIRYHSNDIVKQILITAEVFLSKYNGGIG